MSPRRAKGEGSIPDRLKTRGQRMTLSEFLTARFDEDEAAARAAGGEWWYTAEVPGKSMRTRPDEPVRIVIDSPKTLVTYEVTSPEMAEHIARNHPARVLAECEAKRRMVAEVEWLWSAVQREDELIHAAKFNASWDMLAMAALPYADHPDYQQEWKP